MGNWMGKKDNTKGQNEVNKKKHYFLCAKNEKAELLYLQTCL